MKKIVAVLLVAVLCLSLCACGAKEGGKDAAFKDSKKAYKNISVAYEITDRFGSDVYEAWRVGIYDDDEILSGGAAYLAGELNLSEEEIVEGAAYKLAEISDDVWEDLTENEKQDYRDMVDYSFTVFEEDLFSYCIMVVTGAYTVNGEVAKAEEALADAKEQMKDLSAEHSDYEHYPNLKGFYTSTSSYFEFCCDPDGSFEQVKTTINDYRNEIRDYISDLDYIFED